MLCEKESEKGSKKKAIFKNDVLSMLQKPKTNKNSL